MLTLAVAGALLAAAPTVEREPWRDKQRWPLTLGTGTTALGFFPNGYHPQFVIGTRLTHVRRGAYRLVQPLELGYTFHAKVYHGLHFETAFEHRGVTNAGFFGGAGIGLGIQNWINDSKTYVAGSDGEFRPASRQGRVAARFSVSAILGYDFSAKTKAPLELSVRYQQVVMYPYAPKGFIPVMGHVALIVQLGVYFGGRKKR